MLREIGEKICGKLSATDTVNFIVYLHIYNGTWQCPSICVKTACNTSRSSHPQCDTFK